MSTANLTHHEFRVYAPNGTLIAEVHYAMYTIETTLHLDKTGEYTVFAGSADGLPTGTYTLFLQHININIVPLPGFSNPPTDPDGDGLYEDLNANNRKDFNDVVLMFNQMQWISANEPVSAFDFNGNGRIDFNDIVKLFGEI